VKTHFPLGDGPGLVLTPFRGVRYAPARVGELANVTSPPYDVIGPGTLEHLLDASPYNVVRLILPTYAPGGTPGGDPGRPYWYFGPDQSGVGGTPLAQPWLIPNYNPHNPF